MDKSENNDILTAMFLLLSIEAKPYYQPLLDNFSSDIIIKAQKAIQIDQRLKKLNDCLDF